MKERRYQKGIPSLTQIWTGIWLALLVFFGVLWATDASAQYYHRDQPYRGWHADMELQERRQTQLMERQERREQRREQRESAERTRQRRADYHERLRSGEW